MMPRAEGRPQFSLAGIPVRIELTFFLVIAILGFNPIDPDPADIVSWVIVAFVSILLHELGHAVAFRAYGLSPSITLHGFGGLTSGSGELTPLRHIVVSLAGPLSALVLLGLPAWWLAESGVLTSPQAQLVVEQAVWINIGWSLLNLVPVLPLDGGQVFQAVADLVTGGRGQRVAQIVSVAVAVGLAAWAIAIGFIFAALLAAMFAGINVTALSRERGRRQAQRLGEAQRALLRHDPATARAVIDEVLANRPSGEVLHWAAELAAWAALWQGDRAAATQVLARYAHAGAPSASYRAAEALAAGDRAQGVALMAWAFANEAPGPAKSLGAVAAAGSGCAVEVARELLLLGPAGVQGASILAQLLEHTGYRGEAAEVARLLPITPRPAS